MSFREIKYTAPFKKDLKRLSKKFRTLEDDLRNFIKAQLVLFHKLGIDNDGIKQVPGLTKLYPTVYKARKFACRSLKGKGAKSGIRVIYAYFEERDTVEFIEIYFKGEKEMENTERIKDYLSSIE